MMTNIPGVLDKEGKLLTTLTPSRIDELIEDGTLYGGMLPKIASAVRSRQKRRQSYAIVDGRVPNALLLEVLTDDGVGSMILGEGLIWFSDGLMPYLISFSPKRVKNVTLYGLCLFERY